MTPSEVDEVCARNLLDTSEEIIYFKDLDSRFVRVSLGCARANDMTQAELVGLSDADLFDAEYAAETLADEAEIARTGRPLLNKQECHRRPGRDEIWVSSSKFPLFDPDGQIIGTFGISRDVTPLVLAEREAARLAEAAQVANEDLRRVEARLRAVLDGSTDAIAKYDRSLRYEYINPAGERSRGASMAELLGRTDRETGMAAGPLSVWEPALARVAETGEPDEIEFSVPDAVGVESWFHTSLTAERDAEGRVVGVLASTRDVSDLKRAELALAHQAMHDPVTGLANRYLLTDRLEQALGRLERAGGRVALFFVDLDHFKEVNDTYGHDVGDRVLVEFARRLERVARRQDTVARLGGDEFVLLCDSLADETGVEHIAERIVRVLASPYHEAGLTVRLSASVGAVVADDASTTASMLLRSADSAMYRSKDSGRNRYTVFDPEAQVTAPGAGLERELRSAVDADQLRLVYRPLLSLGDQRVLGFKASARWDHPTRGLLEAEEFLAGVKERGLVGRIGAWVLENACAQLARWQATRPPTEASLLMAVHVTGDELREPGFTQRVLGTLDRNGLAPDVLRLGLTERALVHDVPDARDLLLELTAAGLRLAVDDFGSTYRSLAALPYVPVGVVGPGPLDAPADERGVVTAVVAMAHGLGMSVVGEGIETTPELVELVDLVGDDGQGFLLAVRLDPGEAGRLLTVDAGRTVDAEGAERT